MAFNLSKQRWRIVVWEAARVECFYFVYGPKWLALKEASLYLRWCKYKGLKQCGSLYKSAYAELRHPAFGLQAFVKLEKWD